MGEIFDNLIVNAVSYNDKPDKWVEIGFQNALADASPVFYVRDNGIGIPEKRHEAMFRIFKRLHDPRPVRRRHRCRAHHRQEDRRTSPRPDLDRVEPGEGTTFYFTLAKGDNVAEHRNQPILLVEDSPEDFETTQRAFRRAGLRNPMLRCSEATRRSISSTGAASTPTRRRRRVPASSCSI